jgi:tetratricopeptide (TPR) repeat protein
MYLLENSPEAIEMCEKVSNLLESTEEAQVLLGLQLLEGGGVPETHLTYLLALKTWSHYYWENPHKIKMKAKVLLEKWATPAIRAYLRTHPLKTPRELKQSKNLSDFENNFSKYITQYTAQTALNADILAVMGLILLRLGGRYLMEKQVRSSEWVLEKLVHNYASLNLVNFGLTSLPETVGKFTHLLSLDISGNPLEDVPESLKNLKSLYDISFDEKLMTENALQKLMKLQPHLVGNTLYNKGLSYKFKVGKSIFPKSNPNPYYIDAIHLFEKAVQCRPEYAEIWHNLGACWVFYGEPEKGKDALETAKYLYLDRILHPQKYLHANLETGEAYNYFWISCICALRQDKAQGISYIQKIKHRYYLNNLKTEEDWAMYRQDADFQEAITLNLANC